MAFYPSAHHFAQPRLSTTERPRPRQATPYYPFRSIAAQSVAGESPARSQARPYVSLTCRHELVRSAGHSSEGYVNVMRSAATKELRVFKVVPHKHNHEITNDPLPPNEADMLRLVGDHDNILRCFEAEHNPYLGKDIMCMEFCAGGGLFHLAQYWYESKIDSQAFVVRNFMVQIAEAIAFVHGGWVRRQTKSSYRVTQRKHTNLVCADIKLENFFIRPGSFGHLAQLVLADFGQAFDPLVKRYYGGGTTGYQSPEQKSRTSPISQKSDVYSMAVTIVALCKGPDSPLYSGGQGPVRLNLPQRFAGLGIRDLLAQCLEPDSNNRPEMSLRGTLYHITQLRSVLEDMERTTILPRNCWPLSAKSRIRD